MESLAIDTAMSITNVVARRVFEEVSLAWGFKGQLEKLKERLLDAQALMNDLASAKHAEKSQLVGRWIQKLKDVAFSAEDLMDDYAYEMLRRDREVKINERCRNYFRPSTNPIVFRTRMTHRVEEMLSDLDQLYSDPNIVGMQLARKAAASSTSAAYDADTLFENRKLATVPRHGFIGRDDDENILLQKLLYPGDHATDLPIIAIVGIGGLGKTTLARQIFGNEKINEQFMEKKIWICVSEDFHIDRILKEMIESLTSTNCDLTNTDAIIKKLKEKLDKKKYFLVLDDIWDDNKDRWDSLKSSLLMIGGLSGSAILITTRSMGVANNACSSYTHELKGLSKEEGWDLLKQEVFNETMSYDSSFDDVGKRIVSEKCKGVPLAIKSIGGVLQSKKHKSDWELIERSELWNIKSNAKNYIMPSLLLSYIHMDHVYIKQCFAYCAIFPKDSVMEKGQLIAQWMAQGLLRDEFITHNMSAIKERIGEICINILVKYSFLEEERKDGYKMHDLVHDLATYISKKDLLVWEDVVKRVDVDSHVQHLAFNLKEGEIVLHQLLNEEKMRKLRTISFWNGTIPRWKTLICARYIRTLVMAKVGLTEVPSSIGKLVHLRYLDLSENKIKSLPESMCKLYHLQTLRLLGCDELKKLPRELHRLENLIHIETSNPMFASRGLRKLTRLQTLPYLELRDGKGWTIDELGNLEQLQGEVYIKGLEHVKSKDEAREAGFDRKAGIQKLNISWGLDSEGNNDKAVLKNLEPHPKLESLIIDGFKGVRFPSWIRTMSVKQSGHSTQLSHLTEVELSCCIKCQQLPTLGQLPMLTTLKLENFDEVECIGEELYGNESNINNCKAVFPALRELRIIRFEKLTNWMPPSSNLSSSAAFPNLETLEIEKCKQLERVPSLELKSVKDVCFANVGGTQLIDMIKGCPAVNSLEVRYMSEIERLPKELSNCRNLQTLEIENCPSLGSIEDGVLQGLSSLRELTIRRCSGLKKMGKSLEDCTSLETLWISDCPLIEDPVPDIGKLQGLRDLDLRDVGRMVGYYIPRWIPQLHLLRSLRISGWGEEWDMSLTSNLTSLTYLYLRRFPNMKQSQPTQTLQQLLPPSLEILSINKFEEMEAVPEWIGYLSSLRRLILWDCKRLKELPSKEAALLRLSQLHFLVINGCPLLKERCAKDTGPDWPKIQHIPNIIIDSFRVQ